MTPHFLWPNYSLSPSPVLTGGIPIKITYCEVYFIIKCKNGQEYYDWTNGLHVDVGATVPDNLSTIVDGNIVVDVVIDDWKVTYR